MAAALFVAVAPGDEELSATRRESGNAGTIHKMHGEKSEQDEMYQRKEQAFGESAQFLERHTAGQGDVTVFHKPSHARQRIGSEPDVGVDEKEQRIAREFCEDVTSVLLSAPASRQWRSSLKSKPPVPLRQFTDDAGRTVVGMIVQHKNFEVATPIGEHCFERRAYVSFFIARRDENA